MMVATHRLTRKVRRLEDLHFSKTEATLRSELLQALVCERTKRELADAARTDDADLIDRLFDAGFNGENLSAISMVPIALVAWGSGYVTGDERATALKAAQDSELLDKQAAVDKFKSWLDSRPDGELLQLWADFTKSQSRNFRPGVQAALQDRIIRLASEVALASGGIMGFGAICSGEQAVLDRIREALNDPADRSDRSSKAG